MAKRLKLDELSVGDFVSVALDTEATGYKASLGENAGDYRIGVVEDAGFRIFNRFYPSGTPDGEVEAGTALRIGTENSNLYIFSRLTKTSVKGMKVYVPAHVGVVK